MKILIVEDNKVIREGICGYLKEFGYETIEADNGIKAIEKFDSTIDLTILDIQLPFLNGLEVLKEIRKKSKIPILILTAFGNEEYKIEAFSSLADGYIEKPLSLPVLKVRIESLLKRHSKNIEKFQYKNTEVNFSSYKATVDNKEIIVNAKEIEILKYLLNNEGRALTRENIISNVWRNTEEIPFDRVIDVYIKELRKKLKLDCIITIRNVGYKLEKK
ncbi:response regulator transcription factor [Gemelliphila asaccharolytica]|uniref:Response regulator receiver domain protein n=1 Tax=Gemelliphila asaccharolytica TaxID=502393 RepID=A0ABR5TLK4_9BACL|nr:response regulator transcription factor [Gemella asaccharolytica]KXB57836.1 response regulator receiver domain protein [Gemella asaccharolytica]